MLTLSDPRFPCLQMGTIILYVITPPGEAHSWPSDPSLRWLPRPRLPSHLFHHCLQSGFLPTPLWAPWGPFYHRCSKQDYHLMSDDKVRYAEQCSYCYAVNLFVANNVGNDPICLLSLLWQECLVSSSSHLACPLFCVLDNPLPPETDLSPRLWLLSALCWGHWWPGGRWGDTCWLNTAQRARLLYFTGEKCNFHTGCHQQVGRFEPADQCPWASP